MVMSSSRGAWYEELRSKLLGVEEALRLEAPAGTEAGVLVPLYLERGELHAVFTKRREDLRRHPGEISFPGGRYDEGEPDLLATALREAEEEIGLARQSVEVVGALTPISTFVTGYAVHPFVGVIEPGQQWALSAREVAQVLEFSLAALRTGYAKRRLVRRGIPIRTDTYVVDDHLIWGATARILGELLERLGPS